MIGTKTDRIAKELAELPVHNKRLYDIVQLTQAYSLLAFGKSIMITEINRTPEENTALYPAGAEPAHRPHTKWEAVDLRSWVFTDGEIQKLLSMLNTITVYKGQRKCGVYHAITNGAFHLHIQCPAQE